MGYTNFDSPSFKAALDNYITGGHYREDSVDATCPKCKRTWTIEGYTEYGAFNATNEDEWICKDCDVEAES